jgi:hypothetical protein
LGIIEDVKQRNDKGEIIGWYIKIKYLWKAETIQNTQNQQVDKPTSGKRATNALNVNKLNALNANTSKTKFCGKDINFLIGLFEPINIMFSDFYKNKSERKAIDDLLEAISKKYDNPVQKLEFTIKALQITNKQKFCPKITKPTE